MRILNKVSIVFILAILIGSPAFVSAAPSAGIKPGSFFYFFDTTFEKVGLFFTFNPQKKAEKALEYADERLAEIEDVAEEKDSDAIKTAITNYESNVALATEKSKEVKDKGQAENLLNLISDNASKNQEFLTGVLAKVPDEAKEAITRAIEASKRGQEEAMKQVAELKGEVEKLKQEIEQLKAQNEESKKLIKGTSESKTETPSNSASPLITPSKPTTSQILETPKPIAIPNPASAPIVPQVYAPETTEKNYTYDAISKLDVLISENESFKSWLNDTSDQLRTSVILLANKPYAGDLINKTRNSAIDLANSEISIISSLLSSVQQDISTWQKVRDYINNNSGTFMSKNDFDSLPLPTIEHKRSEISEVKNSINNTLLSITNTLKW